MTPSSPPRATRVPPPTTRGERWRLWLFLFYSLFYLGFMLLTTFNLELMASEPFGGVNLAILYGLALIGVALALALLYMWLCREVPSSPAWPGGGRPVGEPARGKRVAREDAAS